MEKMKTIVTSLNLPEDIVKKYEGKCIIECHPLKYTASSMPPEALSEADAFLGSVCTREMIDSAPKLKIISCTGAGYDKIEYQYAGSKGIWVMNAPYATTQPTAELTIALILCLSRRILNFNRLLHKTGKAGGYSFFVEPFDNAPSSTVSFGKTLGIVGFGKIGRAVALKAKGLGMDVIYYDAIKAPEDIESGLGARYVPFEGLLKSADVVSLHTPYTQENHHLMDAGQFKMMKHTAYFINAARGKLMNERALIEAVKNREIAGAALDVFEMEPEVTQELFTMDEVLLVPHIGTAAAESRRLMACEALDGICGYFETGESETIVNREFYVPQRA
jgi:lactate dehydrogenase-like 2-hydroxyacid dehydrogenase